MRTDRGMTRNLIVFAALLLATLGVAVAPVSAEAAVDTCQGKDATIVKETGTVSGTDGDDVIIGGPYTVVLAGPGDDTVCASGGTADGGSGVDSIQLIGHDIGEGLPTVVDFEHLDLRTNFYLGEVHLEWTEVPTELMGTVVRGLPRRLEGLEGAGQSHGLPGGAGGQRRRHQRSTCAAAG